MHRLAVASLLALFATACVAAPASEEAGGAPLGDERLRIHGPPVRLSSGERRTGEVLYHSVVTADVSLDWSGVRVNAAVPRDFWAEVQGYLVDVTAGTDVVVQIDGPRVQTLTKLVGSDHSDMSVGNDVHFVATETGTVLVMVIPSEIRPGRDHIVYYLQAFMTPPTPSADTSANTSTDASTSTSGDGTWQCDPAYFGSGDGCDCGCGALDPDCAGLGCAEPGCSDSACSFCYDEGGSDVGCTAPEWQ